MDRRAFLMLAGATATSGAALFDWAEGQKAIAAPGQEEYQGSDFTGWELALGDGLYAAPGQQPLSLSDISTQHFLSHSVLQANTQLRGVMAHNITFQRIVDPNAFTYVHHCEYEYRLPYIPVTNGWPNNGQTLEVSFFVWDGGQTRLDYGMAFQWILNPWLSSYGAIRIWADTNGGEWQNIGYMQPDTAWHQMQLVIDYQQQTTALRIDGQYYLSRFAATPKPATWDNQTAARLAAEVISLYPGNNSVAPMHIAEFRNWRWSWLPTQVRGNRKK